MAATRAMCQGYTRSGWPQAGKASRLGSGSVFAEAATWHTFVRVTVNADGSGVVSVTRDEIVLFSRAFGPEEGRCR